MSASPLYSSTATATAPSTSASLSSTTTTTSSASISPYTISSSPAYTSTTPPSPSSLFVPVSAPPTITALPSPGPGPKSTIISENYLLTSTIVLGILLVISILHIIYCNNKYKKEKMRRATEVRANPLHSQVRTILPS